MILSYSLQKAGYEVLVAHSAEEALDNYELRIKNYEIDLILLDIMMDGMSGLEMAEKLRSDIEMARRTGKIILIAQHEPLAAYTVEKGNVPAVIVNGGALKEVNFQTPDIVGASENNSGPTGEVAKLITSNADVIKAVIAGHWHSQFYGEINGTYEKDGKTEEAKIPEFVISGNPYHEAGFLARFIIK
jgi:CheY-like chemotaxis protein